MDVEGVEDLEIGWRKVVRTVGSEHSAPTGGGARFGPVTTEVSKVVHSRKEQPPDTLVRRHALISDQSVFGKSGKITLGLPIPRHSREGMFPPALHLLQSALVGFVTPRDGLVQMLVLRFYDLIGGISVEREVTRSTQLFACHGLHGSAISFGVMPGTIPDRSTRERSVRVVSAATL
jgi:hypothetical protein